MKNQMSVREVLRYALRCLDTDGPASAVAVLNVHGRAALRSKTATADDLSMVITGIVAGEWQTSPSRPNWPRLNALIKEQLARQ